MTGTYRAVCGVDGCDTRFIAVSKDEYAEHLREEHSVLKARIMDEMVIDEPSELNCADAKEPEGEGVVPAQSSISRGELKAARWIRHA